jgi:hypothetical protein
MEDQMADLNQEYNTICTQLNNLSNELNTTTFTTPQELLPVFTEEASIVNEMVSYYQDWMAQYPNIPSNFSETGAQQTYNAIEEYIADINNNDFSPNQTGDLVYAAQVYIGDLSGLSPPPSATLFTSEGLCTSVRRIQI